MDDLHVSFIVVAGRSGYTCRGRDRVALVGRFYERLGDHAVNLVLPSPASGSRLSRRRLSPPGKAPWAHQTLRHSGQMPVARLARLAVGEERPQGDTRRGKKSAANEHGLAGQAADAASLVARAPAP